MNKIIKQLTDLMAAIHTAYHKVLLERNEEDDAGDGEECVLGDLWVHDGSDINKNAISVDLYHFEDDGLPVCDGLQPCTITFDDGSQATGWLFCMCYNPDDEKPLVFVFCRDLDGDGEDIDIEPKCVSTETLENIYQWLHKQFYNNK